MSDKKFYVTTPIYYVNDKPHIGHAYTTILADVLARYHKVDGQETYFLTGLDEHGQKVQQAAEKRGMAPQEHCDDLAPRFIQLWKKLNIENSDFIRTTETRHKEVVQKILQQVYDNGDIYSDEYEGWYSVSEERFITNTEKDSGEFRDIKQLKEKNYFFKMSKYQQKLIDHINDNPDFICPESRKNEILGFLRQPLGDLCISRPKDRLNWGIELTFDKDYVTYVWFDALINYISAIGYLSDDEKFNKWWPHSLHLIGKDILTTHSVYWTTMLFSLGLPLPKKIFAHGWWLIGESKMSKSLGNVVSPLDLVDEYGVDAVRYYLMAQMVLGQDCSFTLESFITRFNNDLANDFGNLLNRVSGLIKKNFEGIVPVCGELTDADKEIVDMVSLVEKETEDSVEKLEIHTAVASTLKLVSRTNKYLEHQAPWKVAKEDVKRAGTILYVATEALRIAAVQLMPIMPSKTKDVLEVLNALGSNTQWGGLRSGLKLEAHDALFPRLELPKE
ncbi:MAG: methionine--tRNA ligase [Candidatus Omnitrophica bacterium]|nr:methionine--tRNA ligase [Candidatus Omnitrophota bacterium]MBU4333677.1 methionine--tRNA ligase [Candidatus Omnitrophota bacterium]